MLDAFRYPRRHTSPLLQTLLNRSTPQPYALRVPNLSAQNISAYSSPVPLSSPNQQRAAGLQLRPSRYALRVPNHSAFSSPGPRSSPNQQRAAGLQLRPTLYALRPTPYALRPSPYALRPTPFALRPSLKTLVFVNRAIPCQEKTCLTRIQF